MLYDWSNTVYVIGYRW